ncbi:TPA: hypothetical protein ACTW5G_005440 [Klebsiella variicola subsp. variicola]
MGKRKLFIQTTLEAANFFSHEKSFNIPSRPSTGLVFFPDNPTTNRSFDFSPWYGVGIDDITGEWQRQIERFLAGMDNQVSTTTVVNYCYIAGRNFLDFMALSSQSSKKEITLLDIDRNTINGFLHFLYQRNISTLSQRAIYSACRSVLKAIGLRGKIKITLRGKPDLLTFPINPFPGSNRRARGESPLPQHQRLAFSIALREATKPLMSLQIAPGPDLLSYVLLSIALHTGRNTTPLLELSCNCLIPHPRQGLMFLQLNKRRGHFEDKVVIRENTISDEETWPAINFSMAQLIQKVIELTAPLREKAPSHLKTLLWLYRVPAGPTTGQLTTLTSSVILHHTNKLIKEARLVDDNGNQLRLNISRLRKTFINRIYEVLDGDIISTVAAAGNSPQVTEKNYLRSTEQSRLNWKKMGIVLTSELLNTNPDNLEQTPTGHCRNRKSGEYAPTTPGAQCFSFLNCLRCRHYVVTTDDLYRVFSFYWRVLYEHNRVSKRCWKRFYAFIPRLIERNVVTPGLQNHIFRQADIDLARESAKHSPHPFWAYNTPLTWLEKQ